MPTGIGGGSPFIIQPNQYTGIGSGNLLTSIIGANTGIGSGQEYDGAPIPGSEDDSAFPSWVVRDFVVEPAVPGPQIIVNWSFYGDFDPDNVNAVRLVRQERRYPRDVTDGVLLHSETNAGSPTPFSVESYADLSVEDGVVYYYRMFSSVVSAGEWQYSDLASGYALAFLTGRVAQRIWSDIPKYEHAEDSRSTQDSLVQTTAPARASVHDELENRVRYGQEVHYGSQHEYPTDHGFLFRLLQLIATELDRVYALTQHLTILQDIDTAPLDALPVLGERVGVTVDIDVAPERRREEIRRAIPTYYIKGTRDGVATAIKVLIPWEILFQEVGEKIIVFFREGRGFWNPEEYLLMGSPEDPTPYFPGPGRYERNFDKVIVFFAAPPGATEGPSSTQIRKVMDRVIPANLQASHQAIPVFVWEPQFEQAQINISEDFQTSLAQLVGEGARLEITETSSYTWADRFLKTAEPGVAADRLVSDPDWVTPHRRT